jgi:hypothetical protein
MHPFLYTSSWRGAYPIKHFVLHCNSFILIHAGHFYRAVPLIRMVCRLPKWNIDVDCSIRHWHKHIHLIWRVFARIWRKTRICRRNCANFVILKTNELSTHTLLFFIFKVAKWHHDTASNNGFFSINAVKKKHLIKIHSTFIEHSIYCTPQPISQ